MNYQENKFHSPRKRIQGSFKTWQNHTDVHFSVFELMRTRRISGVKEHYSIRVDMLSK